MIYTSDDLDRYNIKSGTMIWACNFALDKSKETCAFKQEPQYGMLASDVTEDRIEKDRKQGITYCQFFIPMGKHGLSWSKSVRVQSRVYADTKEECTTLYNSCISKEIAALNALIEKMKTHYLKTE